jgi:ornithine cyclodeaminase/alanine dehydrogenase-like protein (mu-crystallin family)
MKEIDRRKFLRYTAAAGAGLLLAQTRGKAAGDAPQSSSSDELKIALIGAGAQGQVLMNACLKIPNVRFRAVCDIWESYNLRRAQRMLDKFGQKVNSYHDYRQMLAKE